MGLDKPRKNGNDMTLVVIDVLEWQQTRPTPEFPNCHNCNSTMVIVRGEPHNLVKCPKGAPRGKWVEIASPQAQACDGRDPRRYKGD